MNTLFQIGIVLFVSAIGLALAIPSPTASAWFLSVALCLSIAFAVLNIDALITDLFEEEDSNQT